MSEKEIEDSFHAIFCFECNEIKKINIKYERKIKLLNFEFECGHKNEKKIEKITQIFSKNCNKYINCENKENQKINQINLLFYCKIHHKSYKGYCEICKRNICEECPCEHEKYKEKDELYFTNLQLEELIDEFKQVQNFFNTIYSLDCTNLLINKFTNYYTLYGYMIQNEYFDNNIIWNLKLFYFFFILFNFNKDKIGDKGCISNFEENKDFNQQFWDKEFLENYQQINNDLDFDSIYKLFLISKRINKNEIFYEFCDKVKIFLLENILDAQNSINLSVNDHLLKEKIGKENSNLKFKRNDIKVNLLLLKFTKILIPLNVKRKLINILLRAIVKKYKNYLHKIKPNNIILNSIKRKYQKIKNIKKSIYDSKNKLINIDQKINEINKIKVDDAYIKDNIYFEYDFNEKTLYNTFLYFIQNLYYIKSNEIHFSKVTSINEFISKEMYSNYFSDIEDNNDFLIYDYKEYFNFLDEFKKYFILFNNDVYIKKTINCEALIKALLNNDFEDLIDYSLKDRKELDKLINNLKREIKNTKIEETIEIKELRDYYDLMKNNDFLLKMEDFVNKIYENKKYHNIINKLKTNLSNKKIITEFKNKLINLGGFPNKISERFIQLIGKYFQVKKEFENNIKKIEQYSLEFCQIKTEKKQLEQLINLIKETTKGNNEKNELNLLEKINEKCINKLERQYSEETDSKYKIILDEINKYLKTNSINDIINLIKNDLNDINLNFYIDDSETLLTYCWAIQNDHQEILDFNFE